MPIITGYKRLITAFVKRVVPMIHLVGEPRLLR